VHVMDTCVHDVLPVTGGHEAWLGSQGVPSIFTGFHGLFLAEIVEAHYSCLDCEATAVHGTGMQGTESFPACSRGFTAD
jgi:hypothetical protein